MLPSCLQNRTLGILGGGQLGRMSAMAAARLGIQTVIFCPDQDSPASQVVRETVVAPYDDRSALARFSDQVDYISYEFENIPLRTIDYLESLKENRVFPRKNLLAVTQGPHKGKNISERPVHKNAALGRYIRY